MLLNRLPDDGPRLPPRFWRAGVNGPPRSRGDIQRWRGQPIRDHHETRLM